MRVLVSGACGGLGSRVTELLAGSGDMVFAADVDSHALSRLKGLPRVFPLRMDVTSDADVARARVKIEGAAGGLDAIVCCAGIFAAGPLVEAAGDDMRRALEVNLMGAFRVVKGLFPLP